MEQRPFRVEDCLKIKHLQAASLSPDGRRVVYAAGQYDETLETEFVHLWLLNLDTGDLRQATHGEHNNNLPAWSPDGATIAFVSDRGGMPQIHLMPFDGGESVQLTGMTQGVGSEPVWSPTGEHIAFTAGPAPEKAKDTTRPYRVNRCVHRFDEMGFVEAVLQDVYVAPRMGGDARQLTDDDYMNANLKWSPDGREILYCATMEPQSYEFIYTRLRAVSREGELREIVTDFGHIITVDWLPAGDRIAFTGWSKAYPLGTKCDLFVISADGEGHPENRTESLERGVAGMMQLVSDFPSPFDTAPGKILITDAGKSALVKYHSGGTVHVYRISLDGPENWSALTERDRAHYPLGLDREENKLLCAVDDFNCPPDLYLMDLSTHEEDRLTAINEDFLSGIAKPVVERLVFESADGTEVEGWLLLPDTGNSPFPTVLNIHGGPEAAFGHVYYLDAQILVGAGYAVLMINHRGSSGYGTDFSIAPIGDWGKLDYEDLMAGVDDVIRRGFADPDRLGVFGLSGGGFLTCWIVSHTDRFKAGMAEGAVTNWASLYGNSDVGPWFASTIMGGHLHEIPDVYHRCSPITYAHNCNTPVLLTHGEADYRVPMDQAEQFYTALKVSGCTAEILKLPGGSHAGSQKGLPAIRIAQNEALLDWMNRHVRGLEAAV